MTLIANGLQPRTTYQAGKIKTGDKDEKGLPRRLEGFRFTTQSEAAAIAAGTLWDGYDLRPWGRQWEVYTRCRVIDVALPPGELVIRQAMMRWTGGGPTTVCNGERTSKPVIGPCQCPQPDDPCDEESVWRAVRERQRLAGQKVPAGCKPHTWVSVALPDIDGYGVWTLLSRSERAASEIVQQARLLEAYRQAGQFCPAQIALEYYESRVDGLLRQYNVPVIRVGKSLRAISQELAGGELAAQLPPAPRERIAITRGAAAVSSPASDPEPAPQPVPAPRRPAARTAQQIADEAATCLERDHMRRLIREAQAARVETDLVCVDRNGDVYGELREHLTALWSDLPAEDDAS